ncbi:MAG: hypothetical protein ACYYK0_02055 [Candidatus Eutrophobiaceae bacterium]
MAWITSRYAEAYTALPDQGDAHSVEIWMDGEARLAACMAWLWARCSLADQCSVCALMPQLALLHL